MRIGRRVIACTGLFLLAAMTAPSRGALAQSYTLHPPAIVLERLDTLKRVDRVTELPAMIRNGTFEGATRDWALADTGAAWNATDVVTDATLPYRRLLFGACTDALCVVHYERGGIGKSAHVAAFEQQRDRWKMIWHAYGTRPLQSLAELRELVRNQSAFRYYDECASCVP
jgi:hypothetical protein